MLTAEVRDNLEILFPRDRYSVLRITIRGCTSSTSTFPLFCRERRCTIPFFSYLRAHDIQSQAALIFERYLGPLRGVQYGFSTDLPSIGTSTMCKTFHDSG